MTLQKLSRTLNAITPNSETHRSVFTNYSNFNNLKIDQFTENVHCNLLCIKTFSGGDLAIAVSSVRSPK